MQHNKLILILFLAVSGLILTSCKQNDWIDWRTENTLWLRQNASAEGVITTPTGLQYKIIADPMKNTGEAVPIGKRANITYRGQFINGMVFESGTATFTVASNYLIQGWVEGLGKIHNHGIIDLYIPYDLAYGEEGQGTEGTSSYIPPYSTLIFRIEVNSIQ